MRVALLFLAALVSGCAYLDSIPYSPDSVKDIAIGDGHFRPPPTW